MYEHTLLFLVQVAVDNNWCNSFKSSTRIVHRTCIFNNSFILVLCYNADTLLTGFILGINKQQISQQ